MHLQKIISQIKLLNKNGAQAVFQTYKTIVSQEWIIAQWFDGEKNWGDSINPIVIEYFSKRKVVHSNLLLNIYSRPIYMAIGSIIETCNDKKTIVWGSGLISDGGKPLVKPNKICAVRGPRTREQLIKNNISCPRIYGDPALLFPRIYRPDVEKKYKLGIIPHYVDAASPQLKKYEAHPEIKIINVRDDVFNFVDDICMCKSIVSSSLHGLIAADAYGIPSLWMKMSDRIVGGTFKFLDYYESIGLMNASPVSINSLKDVDDVVDLCNKNPLNIDLDGLVDSCPFFPEILDK